MHGVRAILTAASRAASQRSATISSVILDEPAAISSSTARSAREYVLSTSAVYDRMVTEAGRSESLARISSRSLVSVVGIAASSSARLYGPVPRECQGDPMVIGGFRRRL